MEISLPKVFKELVGHEKNVAAFKKAFASGRFPHAFLLSGKKGVGKATFAYQMAAYVLALGNVSEEEKIRRQIEQGMAADLKVIEREFDEKKGKFKGEISVDKVRTVGDFFTLTSSGGGFRVVIIDALDEMNFSGLNAILKILEEPPKNALIFAITHNEANILPTIKSRTVKLKFDELNADEMSALLTNHAPELATLSKQVVKAVSGGSIGLALEILEQGGMEFITSIVFEMEQAFAGNRNGFSTFASKMSANDDGFNLFSRIFLALLDDIYISIAKAEVSSIVISESLYQQACSKWNNPDLSARRIDYIRSMFNQVDNLNLEKSSIIISALEVLASKN